MLGDVDGWNVADILTHDLRPLDADGQAKFFTGISKPVYQSLEALCGAGRKCSIIGKEKFTNEGFAYLTFCFQAGYIEELAVRSGVDVDAIFRGSVLSNIICYVNLGRYSSNVDMTIDACNAIEHP